MRSGCLRPGSSQGAPTEVETDESPDLNGNIPVSLTDARRNYDDELAHTINISVSFVPTNAA